MDMHLGYNPTRHLSLPAIFDREPVQPLGANVVPQATLASNQKCAQKMFAAPNRSLQVIDDVQSVTEEKHHSHPLLLQSTNSNNAWSDSTVMAYPDSPFSTKRINHTMPSHHSSITSLEMSEQL